MTSYSCYLRDHLCLVYYLCQTVTTLLVVKVINLSRNKIAPCPVSFTVSNNIKEGECIFDLQLWTEAVSIYRHRFQKTLSLYFLISHLLPFFPLFQIFLSNCTIEKTFVSIKTSQSTRDGSCSKSSIQLNTGELSWANH